MADDIVEIPFAYEMRGRPKRARSVLTLWVVDRIPVAIPRIDDARVVARVATANGDVDYLHSPSGFLAPLGLQGGSGHDIPIPAIALDGLPAILSGDVRSQGISTWLKLPRIPAPGATLKTHASSGETITDKVLETTGVYSPSFAPPDMPDAEWTGRDEAMRRAIESASRLRSHEGRVYGLTPEFAVGSSFVAGEATHFGVLVPGGTEFSTTNNGLTPMWAVDGPIRLGNWGELIVLDPEPFRLDPLVANLSHLLRLTRTTLQYSSLRVVEDTRPQQAMCEAIIAAHEGLDGRGDAARPYEILANWFTSRTADWPGALSGMTRHILELDARRPANTPRP